MNQWTILKCLSPGRLAAGLRRRGVAGAACHGLRKAGALLGRELVGPYLLGLNPVGTTCNHACPMCWMQHEPKERLGAARRAEKENPMRLADYEALLAQMPAGFEEVNISGGGEPLLHPELIAILQAVKRRGTRGMLITNGTLLSEEKSRALAAMRWDLVRVSVHAGEREAYRRIHNVDRFETLRENLKGFTRARRAAGPGAAARCVLALMFVVQHDNIGGLEQCFALAEEVGADSMIFKKIMPYDDAKWLTREELERARATLESCARASAVPCNLEEILPQLRAEEACLGEDRPFVPARACSIGYDWVYLSATGEVLPCCYTNRSMGNVRERPFAEIWHSAPYRELRRRLMRGEFYPFCRDNRCTMDGVLHN